MYGLQDEISGQSEEIKELKEQNKKLRKLCELLIERLDDPIVTAMYEANMK
jgi:cell shape-determining protein MreC